MPECLGKIEASFANVSGHTQFIHKFHSAPLKIAKAFPFENGQLGVYTMDSSPGLMAGDRYEMDWELGEGANVFVTNQSFTKIHPSRGNPACQKQSIRMGSGAFLEYIPEPVMLYKEAQYHADLEIRLKAGSIIVFSDIICPGRTQHGEIFQYDLYDSMMRVFYEEELIYYSRQRFEPSGTALTQHGCWEDNTHVGFLYVFADSITQEHVRMLRSAIDAFPSGIYLHWGISQTYKHGLVVSVLGSKVWEIQKLLTHAWGKVRELLFSLPPLEVRK